MILARAEAGKNTSSAVGGNERSEEKIRRSEEKVEEKVRREAEKFLFPSPETSGILIDAIV